MAQWTFPVWGLEDDAGGEREVRAGVGVGRTPGHRAASYQLASEGLRSHLKCWVDGADKQGNWIGPKPKRVTAPPEWSTSKQSR